MSRAWLRKVWVAWAALSVLGACSVQRNANPQYKSCSECERLGGTCIKEYCLLPSGSTPDAAVPDGEPCAKESAVELCYGAEDKSTAQQPPCHVGSRTCRDGFWSACENEVRPEDERCNGSDDDCDGRVDEQLEQVECDVPEQQGACLKGRQVCVAGAPQCLQTSYARADTCNGQDDDCDGNTDEGTQLRCYPDAVGCKPSSTRDGSYDCTGQCTTGTRACVGGEYSDSCEGSVTPAANERCSDSGAPLVDEDCDGQADEGCLCKAGASCYDGPSETQVNAPCHPGTQACTDATHGSCQDQVTPQVEDCSNEGVDDDCDGVSDNIPARDTACAEASHASGVCKAHATWQCQNGKQVCVDASPQANETCDGAEQDEDCDGKVDEGFDLQADEANCGACGHACSAGLTCCGGACVDTSASKSHCGACGTTCGSAETCCSSSCVNTGSSAANCGACGAACGLLQSCSSGSCKLL